MRDLGGGAYEMKRLQVRPIVQAAPEPGSLALLGLGVLTLGALRRRRLLR